MWGDAQHDGRPAKYRWRPLWKFRNSIPCTMLQSLAMLAGAVPRSNAANIGERKSWTSGKVLPAGKRLRKCIYSVPAQETAKHRAKFAWPLLSDIAAVTKARCETHLNLLGCRKLTKPSQQLVGRSSPYCGDIWSIYCCLKNFFPTVDTCLSCEDTAWQRCAMVLRCWPFASFLRPVFQRATCSTFQTCILNSH